VLWFLDGCLVLVQVLAFAVLVKSSTELLYVLLFAFLSLVAVLAVLVLLFYKSPGFLLAEQQDVRILSILQAEAYRLSPKLFAQLVKHLTPKDLEAPRSASLPTYLTFIFGQQ